MDLIDPFKKLFVWMKLVQMFMTKFKLIEGVYLWIMDEYIGK